MARQAGFSLNFHAGEVIVTVLLFEVDKLFCWHFVFEMAHHYSNLNEKYCLFIKRHKHPTPKHYATEIKVYSHG